LTAAPGALVAALAAVVVAQVPPPSPQPLPASPQPAQTSAGPSPGGSPAASPGPLGTAVATAFPTATPTPLYKFVYRPAPSSTTTPVPGPNPPEIDEIDLNDSSLVPPAPLHVRVLTGAAVVSVAAQCFGRSIAIPQKTIGEFTFDGYIPQVPGFLRNRTFNIEFVAKVEDGRSASITLPLTLR
jgi:hypothetical protein